MARGDVAGYVFQSTPDYLNRENAIHQETGEEWFLFQSTPDYLNRENTVATAATTGEDVSIHSRLFKPGESILYRNSEQYKQVSIHSRLFKPGEL